MADASKIFVRKTDNNSVSIKTTNTNNIKVANPQQSILKITQSTGGTNINIIPEFDIEVERGYNDVYNVPAIHQLLEIFAFEIAQLQEAISKLEEQQPVYCEVNANFEPDAGRVYLRNWVTTDPYQTMDIANKQHKAVMLIVNLFVDDEYTETVYMNQSLYADTSFGHFKYFLGFVDDANFGYLRINSSGATLIGLHQI